MKKNKGVVLYNMLFPVWMLFLFIPQIWLVSIVGNFLIDSLVLLLGMKFLHCADAKVVWKSSILRVWGIGFLADIIGAALMMAVMYCSSTAERFYFAGEINEILYALPAIVLSGVLIYIMNRHFAFKKTALDIGQKNKLALILALFTAPYTFMVPVSWIY